MRRDYNTLIGLRFAATAAPIGFLGQAQALVNPGNDVLPSGLIQLGVALDIAGVARIRPVLDHARPVCKYRAQIARAIRAIQCVDVQRVLAKRPAVKVEFPDVEIGQGGSP